MSRNTKNLTESKRFKSRSRQDRRKVKFKRLNAKKSFLNICVGHCSTACCSAVLGYHLMKYASFGIDSLKDLEEPGDDEVVHHCAIPPL